MNGVPVGIPFGDPRHPFKPNSEHARKAGRKGKAKSPWGKFQPGWLAGRRQAKENGNG